MDVAANSIAQMVQRTRPKRAPVDAFAPIVPVPIVSAMRNLSLETISLLDQVIGQRVSYFKRFVFSQSMFGYQLGQKSAIDAASQIVPRGNRKERPRVVIKANGVIKSRSFRRLLTETKHTLRTVVKPPRRSKPKTRIVSGQRRQLATISAFVQREKNDGKVRFVPKPIEQRAQCIDIICGLRNVSSHVAAVALINRLIMIAHAAWMNLHHQAVLKTHGRHFSEHLCAE